MYNDDLDMEYNAIVWKEKCLTYCTILVGYTCITRLWGRGIIEHKKERNLISIKPHCFQSISNFYSSILSICDPLGTPRPLLQK